MSRIHNPAAAQVCWIKFLLEGLLDNCSQHLQQKKTKQIPTKSTDYSNAPERLLHPYVGVVVVAIVVSLAAELEAVVCGEGGAEVAPVEHAAGQAPRVQPVRVLQPHQSCHTRTGFINIKQ